MGTRKIDITFLDPVIEIAGPTPRGYKILQELGIKLPENVVVTNIENPAVLHDQDGVEKEYPVDQIVNANELPYGEGEVGTFLCSFLPYEDQSEESAADVDEIVKEYEEAIRTGVAHGTNMRIKFLVDAYKCLKPRGLVIMQGAQDDDVKLAKTIGYEVITFKPGLEYYDGLILRKN